jgi:hypothetical protein
VDEEAMESHERRRFQNDRNAMLQVLALDARSEVMLSKKLGEEKDKLAAVS